MFKGYTYRKAFLAHSIIHMDVYLPLYQVGSFEAKVFVVGDFTDKPWKKKFI